ncbi:MAG: hypothetical protein ACLQVD_14300 [Capsulimonadaceae bacterium]
MRESSPGASADGEDINPSSREFRNSLSACGEGRGGVEFAGEPPSIQAFDDRVRAASSAASAGVTLVSLFLIVAFAAGAGPLWRDEVNSLAITEHASLTRLWSGLKEDSFPILWFLVLRVGQGLGLLSSDGSYRALGAVTGVAVVGAIWVVHRQLKAGPPILSLALIFCNPLLLRILCANRAYGIGAVLILLTIGAVWTLCEDPSWKRFAAAAAIALCATQSVFFNAVFVAGICAAGAVVSWQRESPRGVRLCLATGGISALSLAPYYNIIRYQHTWAPLLAFQVHPSLLLTRLCEAASGEIGIRPLPAGMPLGWLLALVLVGAVVAFLPIRRRVNQHLIIYLAGLAILTGTAYLGFLCVLGRRPVFWYMTEILVLGAVCIDAILARSLRRANETADAGLHAATIGAIRVIAATALVVLSMPAMSSAVTVRQTNADLVAADFQRNMSSGDLFVVWPSGYSVIFSHYPVTRDRLDSIPPLRVLNCGGPDFLLESIHRSTPCRELAGRMRASLAAGHTVWIAGNPLPPPDASGFGGELPDRVRHGTQRTINAYLGGQVSRFITEHATHIVVEHPRGNDAIWPFEDILVTRVSGWKPDATGRQNLHAAW